MKIYKMLIVLSLLVLSACVGLSVPKSLDQQSSAIGISLKLRPPIKIGSFKPEGVFFIKLDRQDEPYYKKEIIQSNYSKGKHVYLLNAPPGRYAAVAVFLHTKGGTPTTIDAAYRIYLPKELIDQSIVTVTPGTLKFMGEYLVETSIGLDGADEAQLHYSNLLEPQGTVSTSENALSAMLGGGMRLSYSGRLKSSDHTKKAEEAFLNKAEKHLKKAGWVNIIDQRKVDINKDQ